MKMPGPGRHGTPILGETMRRRWLVLLGSAVVACLVSGAVIYCWLMPRDSIQQANGERIEPGMSLAQVEALLDRKADSILTVGGIALGHVWIGADGSSILVAFDDQGRVVSRAFTPSGPPSPFSSRHPGADRPQPHAKANRAA